MATKSNTSIVNCDERDSAEKKFFTVCSTDPEYNSPIIGNGEVVTTVGPTGYHNGFCPEEELVNRTIFWAGRRLRDARSAKIRIPRVPPEELIGATIPLIRFGRFLRTLKIQGVETNDEDWEQILDCDQGTVITTVKHGSIIEQTQSLVCLTYNMLVLHTRFENKGHAPKQLEFVLNYEFGDAEGLLPKGTRLHIRRPHPDDLIFGNVEGTRSAETDLEHRPPHLLESLSVQYEIEGHFGEVHIGRYPLGIIKDTENGGRFIHQFKLEAGESTDLWFWAILSDRTKYSHFIDFEGVKKKLKSHKKSWADFWNTSQVEFDNPKVEAVRKASLYTLRCNASPWTLPPGYLSTHWEGRTFHDEFFPFMGLISSNYIELAERIPNYRLLTLPGAIRRSAGHGAHFGWEVTETGEESAPYGHWVDEQFRHGQISEQTWRYYLHTRDLEDLERFYPVIKGCVEWMIHDALVRDEQGLLKVRTIADISEHVVSGKNSTYAACAVIRCLENAANAADFLEKDVSKREKWRALASELRQNLAVDETSKVYRYADDVDLPTEMAHLGMVYPFSFDIHGEISRNTMNKAWEVYQREKEKATSDRVFSYNWIWSVGRFAAICFYQGLADNGYEVLNQATKSVGPFMAPNEHYREEGGAFLPWLTSGAGAYVYAINAMFVQVIDEIGAILFPAIPSVMKNARFERLLATHGVAISGQISEGKIVSLTAHSAHPIAWSFRIPERVASTVQFVSDVKVAKKPDDQKLITVECKLKKGITQLVK